MNQQPIQEQVEMGVTLEEKHLAIEAIIARHGGRAHVDDIIAEARDPAHLLHHEFQWNDALGAQEHRRWQCRQLLSKVRYLHTSVTGEVVRVVAYIHDVTQPEGYVSVEAIQPNSEQARDQLLAELLRIETLVRRLVGLAEVWQMDKQMNGLLDHVQNIHGLLVKVPVKRPAIKLAAHRAKRKTEGGEQ